MLPLSGPAAGSITALMSVGRPESIAASTARFSSSGVVAFTPAPPNASRASEATATACFAVVSFASGVSRRWVRR